MIPSRSQLIATAASAVLVGVVVVGCQRDHVSNQTHDQTVRSDGTAVQTRSQIRQTDSGATVKETQTQERKVVTPGSSGSTDATKTDPGR